MIKPTIKKDPPINRWGRDALIASDHEQLENHRAKRSERVRERILNFSNGAPPSVDREIRELLHID